jgi:uncharacterized repeat protein (TIGR03843 family)
VSDEHALLRTGSLSLLRLMPRASNYTFLGRVEGDGRSELVVYKPRAGEMPLWDFPEGTLCEREVAAYVLAEAFGWPPVPPTVLRDGPHGPGSVQLFVRADPRHHFFTLRERRIADFQAIALFDVVANNADRKSGHCLLGEDGRVWVVDHGVCFNEEPKLRTVIWDFAGEPLPPTLCGDLRRVAAVLNAEPLHRELSALLSEGELAALVERLDALIRAGRFPLPVGDRPYPWPPV